MGQGRGLFVVNNRRETGRRPRSSVPDFGGKCLKGQKKLHMTDLLVHLCLFDLPPNRLPRYKCPVSYIPQFETFTKLPITFLGGEAEIH